MVYPHPIDSIDENMFKSVADAYYTVSVPNATNCDHIVVHYGKCSFDAFFYWSFSKLNTYPVMVWFHWFQQSQALQQPQDCDVPRTREKRANKHHHPSSIGEFNEFSQHEIILQPEDELLLFIMSHLSSSKRHLFDFCELY